MIDFTRNLAANMIDLFSIALYVWNNIIHDCNYRI